MAADEIFILTGASMDEIAAMVANSIRLATGRFKSLTMKKNNYFRFAGFLFFTLLALWLISRSISLIPSWNLGLYIVAGIICLVLLFLLIRSIYRSYIPPLQTKHWLGLVFFSLLSIAVTFFGFIWAKLDDKNTGLFHRYVGRYHFQKMTFYIYETGLLGTSVHVHYSRPGEIISHKINNVLFWKETESIHVAQSGEDFWIIGGKKRYLFRGKEGVAAEE